MSIANTFLSQVRQKNKKLFWGIMICMALTAITNITRNEITPFYTWSMYSAPAARADTFSLYIFEYNNGQLFNEPHTFMDHKRMMLYYTVDQYAGLLDHNYQETDKTKAINMLAKGHMENDHFLHLFNTDSGINNYPAWLKRYMQENTGIRMDSIRVYRKWVKYDNEGHVYPIKSELILKA